MPIVVSRHHFKNKAWPAGALYVGRGTPLGNPFEVSENRPPDQAVDLYRNWLQEKIDRRDPAVLTALAGISDETVLVCSCHPKPCHANVIVELRAAWLAHGGIRPHQSLHPDGVAPQSGEVFVFGSNLAGRHGAGAALAAKKQFGAVVGAGVGYMGEVASGRHCYAIPTKDASLVPLPLSEIRRHVAEFIAFAHARPDLRFFVTRVGCGLAGYRDAEIGPMFADAPMGRCSLPREWGWQQLRSFRYAGIGSRTTPPEIIDLMRRAAGRLSTRGYVLRSGGAGGADMAFESGASQAEIFLPWPGFNSHPPASGTIDTFSDVSDAAIAVAAAVHPAFSKLTDPVRKLMGRNSCQVLGQDLRSPVDFVVCWAPDGAESERERSQATGGTGQAIALASRWNIPVFNLAKPDALSRMGDFLGHPD